MTRQNQKGGDASSNLQAEQMTVHFGIDEKRAREVFQEMNSQHREIYTKEALKIANERISEFENSLVPKMERVEGALSAFADPGFQRILTEAQKTAASTERSIDYELLSELLVHRFQKSGERVAHAGIKQAVEVVDTISDDALLGLTAAHTLSQFSPVTGQIEQGLSVLDDLFGKIFYDKLPDGDKWLDHLDILNAVRIGQIGGLLSLEEIYSRKLPGYVVSGIEKDSDNHKKAVEILNSVNLSENLLVEHYFNSGFLRIPVANKDGIREIQLQRTINTDGLEIGAPCAMTEDQAASLENIYSMCDNDDEVKNKNSERLVLEFEKYENLEILRAWWERIPLGFSITSAGKVLAHANAQRCNENLPALD